MILVLLFNMLMWFAVLWLALQGIKVLAAVVMEIFGETLGADSLKKCIRVAIVAAVLYAGLACGVKLTSYLKDNTVSARYERLTR